jgi:hypothetical protein
VRLFNIWGFWQSFSRKISFGRTVRGSMADSPKLTSKHTVWCATRVDRADGPQPTHGPSARPWRTVHKVLVDSPLGPTGNFDNSWLRIFIVGIQTRRVCEAIVDSPRGTHFWHNG